jgi:2-desacetyl-2-hydroxyethyl bacteriochlorophyllide A dehydrogenase
MASQSVPDRAEAVWFTGPRQVEVRAEALSRPAPNQVTVKAIRSLISAGTEMKFYRGEAGLTLEAAVKDMPTARLGPGHSIKYAYQCVGTVVEAGSESGFSTGNLVFARHPHQNFFTVPERYGEQLTLVRLPEGMDPETAIFLNLTEVALNGLLDVPISLGDVVVVFGHGVVGALVAQLARRTAGRLVVVDPFEVRRKLALKLGADAAVDPKDANAAVMEVSRGRGADVAIEVSGVGSALQQAINATGRDGTVLALSFYGDHSVGLVLAPEFHIRRIKVASSFVGYLNPAITARWDFKRRGEAAIDLLPTLNTSALISHRFSLEKAPEAFELLERKPDEVVGVALTYDGGDHA